MARGQGSVAVPNLPYAHASCSFVQGFCTFILLPFAVCMQCPSVRQDSSWTLICLHASIARGTQCHQAACEQMGPTSLDVRNVPSPLLQMRQGLPAFGVSALLRAACVVRLSFRPQLAASERLAPTQRLHITGEVVQAIQPEQLPCSCLEHAPHTPYTYTDCRPGHIGVRFWLLFACAQHAPSIGHQYNSCCLSWCAARHRCLSIPNQLCHQLQDYKPAQHHRLLLLWSWWEARQHQSVLRTLSPRLAARSGNHCAQLWHRQHSVLGHKNGGKHRHTLPGRRQWLKRSGAYDHKLQWAHRLHLRVRQQ